MFIIQANLLISNENVTKQLFFRRNFYGSHLEIKDGGHLGVGTQTIGFYDLKNVCCDALFFIISK